VAKYVRDPGADLRHGEMLFAQRISDEPHEQGFADAVPDDVVFPGVSPPCLNNVQAAPENDVTYWVGGIKFG
jgi:hypothetical protein